MPWNGSGLFTRVRNWVTDKNNGIKIVASLHDSEDDNFATGMNNCVTKDGQSKMAADFAANSDAAYDLGTSSLAWRNLNAKGTVNMLDGVNDGARFYNSSNYVELRAPGTLAANRVFTLPNADGTSGQFLQTNGSGGLSFANASGVSRLGSVIIGSSTPTVELTWANPGTYSGFIVLFNKFRAGTAGANLNCFITNNTGGAWNAVSNIASRTTGTTRTEYTSSLLPNLSTTGAGNLCLTFGQCNDTAIGGSFSAFYNNNTDGYVSATGSIYNTSIFQIDGIRFSVSSGNFNLNNATLVVYGLPA